MRTRRADRCEGPTGDMSSTDDLFPATARLERIKGLLRFRSGIVGLERLALVRLKTELLRRLCRARISKVVDRAAQCEHGYAKSAKGAQADRKTCAGCRKR